MDSDDIEQVDNAIKQISWKINSLDHQKRKAMSLTDFYNFAKSIRNEKANLVKALLQYKKLEQTNGFPVKLEYRAALKRLLK